MKPTKPTDGAAGPTFTIPLNLNQLGVELVRWWVAALEQAQTEFTTKINEAKQHITTLEHQQTYARGMLDVVRASMQQ